MVSIHHKETGEVLHTYVFDDTEIRKSHFYFELAAGGSGKPLLFASGFEYDHGIGSTAPEVKLAAMRFETNKEMFWWSLLTAGIKSVNFQTEKLRSLWIEQFNKEDSYNHTEELFDIVKTINKTTLLIDGIETAFDDKQLAGYVEALFRVLSTLQYDPEINEQLTCIAFLKTSSKAFAGPNVEQQIEGKVLYLT